MLKSGLFALILLLSQKLPEMGTIAGTVSAPAAERAASKPVQVVLLSAQFTNLWNSDLQKRLDSYWERYKPAFAQNKEYFVEVSRLAQKESFNYIVARMRRDAPEIVTQYVKETLPGGKFEFKNVPFGDYKILAFGGIENQDIVWQDDVQVSTTIPQFLELKNHQP